MKSVWKAIIIFPFFWCTICTSAELEQAENKRINTAGLFTTETFNFVTVKDAKYFQSNYFTIGGFYNNDTYGLSMNVLTFTPRDTEKAESNMLNGCAIYTDNTNFNKLSITLFSGMYTGETKNPDKITYYPDLKGIWATDSYLYFFNRNISLKNVYLGTEFPNKTGGSFFIGCVTNYSHIENSGNLLLKDSGSDIEENQYYLRTIDYASIAPTFGGMFNLTLGNYFCITYGIGIGPSIITRLYANKNEGGKAFSFIPFWPQFYHASFTFTNNNLYISLSCDAPFNNFVEANKKYEISVMALELRTQVGVRF